MKMKIYAVKNNDKRNFGRLKAETAKQVIKPTIFVTEGAQKVLAELLDPKAAPTSLAHNISALRAQIKELGIGGVISAFKSTKSTGLVYENSFFQPSKIGQVTWSITNPTKGFEDVRTFFEKIIAASGEIKKGEADVVKDAITSTKPARSK